MYKSNDQFEELGKLPCGEKVEILNRYFEYVQVRTVDGRVGWVRLAEVSNAPGEAPTKNFGLTDPSSKPQGGGVPPLNNASIVKMRNLHLSPDVMLAKIQSSPCEFDTAPAGLKQLKQAGVPDKVILAMVMAPSAAAPPVAPKAPEIVEVKIPGGTPVEVELSYAVSSDDAVEGCVVLLKVAQDVVVDGVTVFLQWGRGTRAGGHDQAARLYGQNRRESSSGRWNTSPRSTAITFPRTFFQRSGSEPDERHYRSSWAFVGIQEGEARGVSRRDALPNCGENERRGCSRDPIARRYRRRRRGASTNCSAVRRARGHQALGPFA